MYIPVLYGAMVMLQLLRKRSTEPFIDYAENLFPVGEQRFGEIFSLASG